MAHLEKNNNLQDIQEMENLIWEFVDVEKDLENLHTDVEVSLLNEQIILGNEPEKWKFLNGHESMHKDFMVYEYIIKSHWTPAAVRNQAINQWIATNKTWIQITNGNATQYSEDHNFTAWDKIYVRVPIDSVKAGQFLNKHESKDKNFMVYEYTVKSGWSPKHVRDQAVKQWFASSTDWIEVTNGNLKPYDESHKFKAWNKVYVRIPKLQNNTESSNSTGKTETNVWQTDVRKEQQNVQNSWKESRTTDIETQNENIEIVDWMKCKWWEYFWIDISKFNEDINLEDFKNRNRKKWDSEEPDTRWVSFIYVRSWDWTTEDPKVENHIKKIKEYNNDETIKKNHEQISVWFYHRMNSYDAKNQANTFIKTYNKYKDVAGWNNLVPMLDLEWSRIKSTTKEKVREKALSWLKTVEEKTWIIPWIYITVSLYRDYISNDARFNKYLTRIAAYPGSNSKTGREIWTASRIDFKEWTVDIWKDDPKIITPNMYQSSQEWSVDWAYVINKDGKGKHKKKYYDTDMDHTKDITKLFSKNNLSEKK